MIKKHKYKNYDDYNKAAFMFAKDKSIKVMRTLCDRIKGIYEIEVVRRYRC